MRLEARLKDDGRGPYRWRPVLLTADGLALGGIYDTAAGLDESQASRSRSILADRGYEVREVDA